MPFKTEKIQKQRKTINIHVEQKNKKNILTKIKQEIIKKAASRNINSRNCELHLEERK